MTITTQDMATVLGASMVATRAGSFDVAVATLRDEMAYEGEDRAEALSLGTAKTIRGNLTCLRALRGTWLPMWSLREDTLGRTIRAAARATGAHVDTCRTNRVSRWF